MSGSSTIGMQRDAQFKFTTPFAFMLENGGLGATLSCNGTSSSTLFVGSGQTLLLHNFGTDVIHLAWGEADVEATLNHLPVWPDEPGILYTLPANDNPLLLTHFAGITAGATCRLLVHRGGGV